VVTPDSGDSDPAVTARRDPQEAEVEEQLRRLTNLYRLGVLTDTEFLHEKAKLLQLD
jgi:hypothetical protein